MEKNEKFWKISPLLTRLAAEGSRFGEAPAKEEREAKLSFKDSKNMGGV